MIGDYYNPSTGLGTICPTCRSCNWHNSWLCRECGFPDVSTWRSHLLDGYITPRTREGRVRALNAAEAFLAGAAGPG